MNGEISVEREIFIAASPETVFRFFVEPAFMARWFGQRHTLDPCPGGIFRVEVSAGNFAHGTYTEVTPHRRIAFTWGWEGRGDLPPGRSLVEIELVPKDGGTVLRLRHSGLPQAAEAPFTPPPGAPSEEAGTALDMRWPIADPSEDDERLYQAVH